MKKMTDVAELKKLHKAILSAQTPEELTGILLILKKDVVVTEASIRESKIGLAVGKLRSHNVKEVADLAKEVVKKWKTEVDRAKAGGGHGHHHAGSSTTGAAKKDGGVTVKTAPVQKGATNGSASPATPTTTSAAAGSSVKGGPRSAKSDGVNVNATGDKTRDKCIELVYDSLSSDSGAPNDLILKRATSIEHTVFADFGHATNKQYKDKMRSLYLNLKDKNNPGLRESVVSGNLPVAKFCRMSSQDMASEERKAENEKIQEQNLHNSLAAEEQQAETTAFQCGRCKQWKTRYRQAQTRSADEPMTTFVTCVNCGNRWKFS